MYRLRASGSSSSSGARHHRLRRIRVARGSAPRSRHGGSSLASRRHRRRRRLPNLCVSCDYYGIYIYIRGYVLTYICMCMCASGCLALDSFHCVAVFPLLPPSLPLRHYYYYYFWTARPLALTFPTPSPLPLLLPPSSERSGGFSKVLCPARYHLSSLPLSPSATLATPPPPPTRSAFSEYARAWLWTCLYSVWMTFFLPFFLGGWWEGRGEMRRLVHAGLREKERH